MSTTTTEMCELATKNYTLWCISIFKANYKQSRMRLSLISIPLHTHICSVPIIYLEEKYKAILYVVLSVGY